MVGPVPVVLEVGKRRTFATAVDWPGWCRPGKGDEAAVEALAEYADRYRAVALRAGARIPQWSGELDVVERVDGNATTDFGAPGVVSSHDRQGLTRGEAGRFARLVEAAWATLDDVAARAPAHLRKGPRGGGRDRDAVVEHVVAADAAYARKLGLPLRAPAPSERAAVAEFRAAVVDRLSRPSDGSPPVLRGWPPRYAAHRFAWHALDHAWEIEDRSEPEPG